jgi:predicted RNA-binding protein YlxR (DUF448 family)
MGGLRVSPRHPAGRGGYLCPAVACLERALERKALPRALRRALPGLAAEAVRRAFADALARRAARGRNEDQEHG